MSAIYEAIADLLTLCLAELKKSRHIDTSDMNIEQGLFKSFDDMVRRQMDAVWHTAPLKVKQVSAVGDWLECTSLTPCGWLAWLQRSIVAYGYRHPLWHMAIGPAD